MLKRRHTDKRTYDGEEECRPVLAWISGPPRKDQVEQVARVRQLLEELLELHELWKKERAECATGRVSKSTSNPLTQKTADMASALSRYASVPYILPGVQFYVGVQHLWPEDHDTLVPDPVWTPDGSMPLNEFGVVTSLMHIISNGWLSKVGKCSCGRFFFKRFSNQIAHSIECRRKATMGTEK